MTPTALPFSPLDIPISGTSLIEASAGTGKTYGIAALFARLILLEKMPVDKVLVVTFTKAATAELKTRLRARLDEALRRLQGADLPEAADEFMNGLLQRALEQEPRERLQLRLKAALSQFDAAAIYTIHGFCRRVLGDYAFLCQVPFDTELDENGKRELYTYAQDFWRLHVADNGRHARLVFRAKLLPDALLDELSPYLARPALTFRRPDGNILPEAEKQAQKVWDTLREKLPELAATFWRVHPSLSGSKFNKDKYEIKFAELAALAESEEMPSEKLVQLLANTKGISVFAPEYLEAAVKKGQNPAAADLADLTLLHGAHQAAENLLAAEHQALITLQLDFLQYVRESAAEKRRTRTGRSPDELLLDVYHALTAGTHAETLADTVAHNWPVALIDEFQDTDPLQYEIFRRIFIERRRPLFLVGDPKQAIYAFRGADIYAYLQAAADTPQHYTLVRNFRSHRRLTEATARLFTQKKRPFVLERIGYPEAEAARADSYLSPPQAALNIRWLHEKGEDAPDKALLRQRAADYCADEAAALINAGEQGRLNYHGAPVQPGHIAVLVHSHKEGQLIKRALAARGIAAVAVQRESVFKSHEAQALAALLAFWLEPQRTGLLRFVLGGVLFGHTAAQIAELNRSEAQLAEHTAAAAAACETWQRQGIFAALAAFAAQHGIETRLLREGNERSLTNFWQLAELLAAEDEAGHTPASLHQWLVQQMQDEGAAAEHHLLRLESDEALVKIVTIHASKGLQYPFVFCPFAWDTSEAPADRWHVLHRADGSELLELSQLDEADQNQLADEDLGERLRLLYVALTRAEEQLTIYAARCRSTPRNTFAYLLEGSPDSSRDAVQTAYKEEKDGQSAMLRRNWLRWIESTPADSGIRWHEGAPVSAAANSRSRGTHTYRAAEYPPRRFELVRFTSFTGLTRRLSHHRAAGDELQPALDQAESAAAPPVPASDESGMFDLFHFPRGTEAGVCLHEILEQHDFSRPAAEQSTRIADTLERYGFPEQWLEAACAAADQTAAADLGAGDTLATLPAANRLAEMGFVMHFDRLDLGRLKNSLAAAALPPVCLAAAEHLDFDTLQGFLNGFIDMTCLLSDGQPCVIDYKSNHLGNRPDDYAPAALDAAVAEHHYYLQAWIYALATARYLKQRGRPVETVRVRYLFLRGLNTENRNGIWQWDIAAEHLAPWL